VYRNSETENRMQKNITFSAEKEHIRKARLKAQNEHSTLNEQFQIWLRKYVTVDSSLQSYKSIIEKYDYVDSGGSFSREKLNER